MTGVIRRVEALGSPLGAFPVEAEQRPRQGGFAQLHGQLDELGFAHRVDKRFRSGSEAGRDQACARVTSR